MLNSSKDGRTPAAVRVARNVRAIRERNGLTLAQLSEAMGRAGVPTSLATLSKLELGQRKVSVDDLEALAEALGVTVRSLLAERGEETARHIQTLATLADEERFVLESLLDRAEERRARVDDYEAQILAAVEAEPDVVDVLPDKVRRVVLPLIAREVES